MINVFNKKNEENVRNVVCTLNSLQRKHLIYCEILKTISFASCLYEETRGVVLDFEAFRFPHRVRQSGLLQQFFGAEHMKASNFRNRLYAHIMMRCKLQTVNL